MASYSHTREAPMPSLRMGRRGQITIPSALRRELQLEEGGRLTVVIRDGEMILRPVGRSIFALRGSVPVDGPQDLEAIRAEVAATRARRSIGDQA